MYLDRDLIHMACHTPVLTRTPYYFRLDLYVAVRASRACMQFKEMSSSYFASTTRVGKTLFRLPFVVRVQEINSHSAWLSLSDLVFLDFRFKDITVYDKIDF